MMLCRLVSSRDLPSFQRYFTSGGGPSEGEGGRRVRGGREGYAEPQEWGVFD